MSNTRLQNLFLVSIPLFVAHGLEEYFTGFYAVDSHVRFVFGFLEPFASLQDIFLAFQIFFWTALVVAYILFTKRIWPIQLPFLLGLVFVYELHHVYKMYITGSYYPGVVTAIPLLLLGFFFWKELLRQKNNNI